MDGSRLPKVCEDAFNLLCGELIGRGAHRIVYECSLDPSLVVKVEYEEEHRAFANVMEWHFWDQAKDFRKVSEWLAPCYKMSMDGRILLQRRADPLPRNYVMPEKIPAFLNDHKSANFGLIQGRLVCVDYAITHNNPSMRMQKARWYEW